MKLEGGRIIFVMGVAGAVATAAVALYFSLIR